MAIADSDMYLKLTSSKMVLLLNSLSRLHSKSSSYVHIGALDQSATEKSEHE